MWFSNETTGEFRTAESDCIPADTSLDLIMKALSRRIFLSKSATAGSYIAMAPMLGCVASAVAKPKVDRLQLYVFSKHLQFLDYDAAAETAAEIGFDGIELAVRPKGHVLPERVEEDLPKAVAAIRKAGLKADLMVTRVDSPTDPTHQTVLKTAATQGIKKYRTGYLGWPEEKSVADGIVELNIQMKELAIFNKQLGLQGYYQNHAGTRVGAAIWDIWHLLEGTDKDALGCQYDIRHAVVEGGNSWSTGLRLIKSRINCIVLKDFRWEKANGKWKVVNVPLGEGMVDFVAYFKLLKEYGINVPVSMHFEYDLGGAEHGDYKLGNMDRQQIVNIMKKDVAKAHELWAQA